MIDGFSNTIFNTSFLAQIAAALEKKHKEAPRDGNILKRLAETYRQLGWLGKAAEAYTALAAIYPDDDEIELLQAILLGQIPPPANNLIGPRPTPFVLQRNFLTAEEHHGLIPYVLKHRNEFLPSGVGEKGELDQEYNSSLTLHRPEGINQLFCRIVENSMDQILPFLLVLPFSIKHIQVEIKAYCDGDFFKVHSDCTPWNKRLINFGYFFHRQPRAFSGGDFILYDTDPVKEEYNPMALTRIIPEDNCIIFYPSAAFHEAIQVHCQGGDFADSRFVVVGHIYPESA